ncbi:MAG: XAC2610-related protein [Longimicrobiaceae bacterium]
MAASLAGLAACFGVIACGRRPSAETPSAQVSAAAPANGSTRPVARDSMMPIPRDSADRCRWEEPSPRAHAGEAYELAHWDSVAMGRGVALRCELRGGGPTVRVVVRGDNYSIPRQVEVYSPPGARAATQTLTLDTEEPAYEHSGLMIGQDLNDDGWTDLRVQTWSGTAGISYDVFMWNPRRGRFEQDSVFTGGTSIHAIDGRPCVGEESKSGIGHSGGGEYCWARGGWQKVRTYQLDAPDTRDASWPSIYVRRTEWWAGGKVVRTVVDSLPFDSALADPDFRSAPPDPSRRSRRARG